MEKIIRPKLVPKLQRQITNDWLALFPSFAKETIASISRRVGPILISIGYDRPSGNDRYRVAASIRNLADERKSIGLDLEYLPSRCTSLSWNQHEQGKYKEAAISLRENTPIPLEGPVTLSQVLGAYLAPQEGGYMKSVGENLCLISAWAGKMELTFKFLDWNKSQYEQWLIERKAYIQHELEEGTSAKFLTDVSHINIKEWYDNLKKRLEFPDKIRETVASELERHGLTKIPYDDLIIDDFDF